MTGHISRRTVLAVLGAGVALAGCADTSPGAPTAGGGGNDEDGGDDETPTPRPTAVACTALGDESTAYDAGETELLLDFEYPSVFEPSVERRAPGVVRGSTASTVDDRRLSFGVEQGFPVDAVPSDAATRDDGWKKAFSFGIADGDGNDDNDRQQVWKRPDGTTARVGVAERLFYFRFTRGGDPFRSRVRVTVRLGPDREAVDRECARALDATATRIVRSMTFNEDSTVLP